jgi:ketosteroid isomerase-like protein
VAAQEDITETAEVSAALESFVPLLEDTDPTARASIYADDATFAMPGVLVEGRAAMLARLEDGTILEAVTLTPRAIERRDDLAYAYGDFGCTIQGQGVAMRFLMALRKETDGNWRIVCEFLLDVNPVAR